jgi:hypothetical protein
MQRIEGERALGCNVIGKPRNAWCGICICDAAHIGRCQSQSGEKPY